MRDPHVVSLTYLLVPSEDVAFDGAPSVDLETPSVTVRLAEGGSAQDVLTITMHEHYASEEEAREAVAPYLRAWEIQHTLWAGSPEFHFEFERAKVIDRDPPPPTEARVVNAEAAVYGVAGVSATLTVHRASYPRPPTEFAVDPDVETLWQRWENHLAGGEPLPGTAYFCLTVLQMYGGRRGAAHRFGISTRVLRTLSTLSTKRGDATTARKAEGSQQPLSGPEHAWLEAALRAIIRRAGEVAADPEAVRPELTMADLPSL